jgi:hypothetical protein
MGGQQARTWYDAQPWLVGANYATSSAVNQLEMFQAATFDPATIDRELGWAHDRFGMNTMRVYVHDLLWAQDPKGFTARLEQFLAIAQIFRTGGEAERSAVRLAAALTKAGWSARVVVHDLDNALAGSLEVTPNTLRQLQWRRAAH